MNYIADGLTTPMLDERAHDFGENVRACRKTKGQNDKLKMFSNLMENPGKVKRSLLLGINLNMMIPRLNTERISPQIRRLTNEKIKHGLGVVKPNFGLTNKEINMPSV